MSNVIYAPRLSLNDEYITILNWLVEAWTAVRSGDAVALIEGSKGTAELSAENDGYFVPLVPEGEKVRVNVPVAAVVSSRSVDIQELLGEGKKDGGPVEAASPDSPNRRWTKKAEIVARKYGLQLGDFPGNGLIRESDVIRFVETQKVTVAEGRQGDMVDVVDDVYSDNRAKRLLVLGGGRGCVQTLDVVRRIGGYRAVGILDNAPELKGRYVMGCPVLGVVGDIGALWVQGVFDVTIISFSNDIVSRNALFNKYSSEGIPFCNIIDPSVIVHSNVSMGTGNLIMANCRIGSCTRIGDNNFLSAYVNIEHHNMLGDCCTFGPGVFTSSRVQIGDLVRFGTGIFIEPGVKVGPGSIVASGAILTRDVPPRRVVKVRSNFVIRPRGED